MQRFWGSVISCLVLSLPQCAPEPTQPESPRRGVVDSCEDCDDSQTAQRPQGSDDALQTPNRTEVAECELYEQKQGDRCILLSFSDFCRMNLSEDYKQTVRIITETLKTGQCEATARKLETLDELYLVGPKTGASGIGTLSRTEQQILDVGPLATLTHLRVLNLQNHQIQDWKPLSHLENLEELYLGFNKISNVQGLVLSKLRKLDLRGNKIIDATPLANFFSLGSGIPEGKGLDMRDNPLGNSIEKTPENCPSGQESPSPLKRFCLT